MGWNPGYLLKSFLLYNWLNMVRFVGSKIDSMFYYVKLNFSDIFKIYVHYVKQNHLGSAKYVNSAVEKHHLNTP